MTMGSSLRVDVTNVNTTGGALELRDAFTLRLPDGSELSLPTYGLGPASLAPDASIGGSMTGLTTSALTSQTGRFTLEANAVDANTGTVLGSADYPFTVEPLQKSVITPRYSDLSSYAGVAVPHPSDPTDCINAMGTGAGWADYNGDGRVDLFVSGFASPSHLYRNTGKLRFKDVTAKAFPGAVKGGALQISHAAGVTWADYDNDGHPDLLVVGTGGMHLFHNNGNGTFTDVTARAGLAGNIYRGESAAWGDFNRDGYLDLFVVSYSQDCFGDPISATPRATDHLFRSNGNGTFTDVTGLLGGLGSPAVSGLGFQATWFDANGDRLPDLYVANDYGRPVQRNVLWRNTGSGFADISAGSGLDLGMNAMGIAAGDYNRDGRFDLALSNWGSNVLARNDGGGRFTNVARSAGADRPVVFLQGAERVSVTWGIGLQDLNNDGYDDLFIAGGGLYDRTPQSSSVLLNNLGHHLTGRVGDSDFIDVSGGAGLRVTTARTAAFADFDGDGWVDVLVSNYDRDPPDLYRNEGPAQGNHAHWLEVRLVGAGPRRLGRLPHGSNRDGVGAVVTVKAGRDREYRQVIDGSSLGAGDELAVHFGLARHTKVDRLTVRWPSGYVQTFKNLPADKRIVITESARKIGFDPLPKRVPSPRS
jgi:hypothetical protein